MRYYFLELLACPICKHSPLKLYVIEEKEVEEAPDPKKVRCKEYCGYLERKVEEVSVDVCQTCVRKEILTGVLICPKCGRWYPIIDGIPYMLPDEYRIKKADKAFLEKYFDKIPDKLKILMKNPDPRELL